MRLPVTNYVLNKNKSMSIFLHAVSMIILIYHEIMYNECLVHYYALYILKNVVSPGLSFNISSCVLVHEHHTHMNLPVCFFDFLDFCNVIIVFVAIG